jgi:PAS domain S-box-containing protein
MLTGTEGSGAFTSARGANDGAAGVIAYYLPIRASKTFWSLAVTYDEQEITASVATFRDKLIAVLFLALLGGVSLSYYGIKTWSILRERRARERAEQQLLESEARYRLLFEENPAPMLIYDRQTREVLAVNRSFLRHYGYSTEQAVGMDLASLHPENEQEAFRDLVLELRGYRNTGEWHHRKQDDSLITIVACSDDLDYHGRSARVAVFTDVTDRKTAEEALLRSLKEKEVLLKEIHHRVKNNLQVITSLLSMQAAQMVNGPARAALTESQARVRSIALVHEQFYGASDLSRIDLLAYGQGLTERLAHMWYSPGVTFSVEGERVEVGVDLAVPSALILNELLTNALKHAFVGREGGVITVRIRRSEPGTVEFSVRDNGVGFPEGQDLYRMVSTGMTLIVGLLEQLSGAITLERGGGSTFVVRFPG